MLMERLSVFPFKLLAAEKDPNRILPFTSLQSVISDFRSLF